MAQRVTLTKEVEDLLKARGLSKEDVIKVIDDAETAKKKFYLPKEDKYLGKKLIGNVMAYAIYSPTTEKGVFEIRSAYGHKIRMKEAVRLIMEDVQEWECFTCKEKAVSGTIDMEYLGITRAAPGITCPKCKLSFIEEDIAIKTLVVAETLLEKKRA